MSFLQHLTETEGRGGGGGGLQLKEDEMSCQKIVQLFERS